MEHRIKHYINLIILLFIYTTAYAKTTASSLIITDKKISTLVYLDLYKKKSSATSLLSNKKLLLAERNNSAIFFSSASAKRKFLNYYSSKNLYLIEYDATTPQSSYLIKHPDILAYYKNGKESFAILHTKNKQTLHTTASLAHSGEHNICGKIRRLDLNIQTEEKILHPGPIYPDHIFIDSVNNFINKINQEDIRNFILKISNEFSTRYADSDSGRRVPEFLIDLIKKMPNPGNIQIEYQLSNIPDWQQDNLIITVPGELKEDPNKVIIGAHIDTIVRWDRDMPNPGVDDDASGVATWLSILKTILANNIRFKRTIEFHGYGAEELGLIGSQELAKAYSNNQEKIAAMLQLDMVLYSEQENDTTIHLVSNYTSPTLRRSLKNIMHSYLDAKYTEKPLKWGSSDHVSWYNRNFPTVFPFENPDAYNKKIHTPDDNLENANNINLAGKFAKLSAAFLSHYAGQTGIEESQLDYDYSDDIKLAIYKNPTYNSWNIIAATQSTVDKIEMCQAHSKKKSSCKDNISIFEKHTTKTNSRVFFISKNNSTTGTILTSPQQQIFYGYDHNDKLIFKRTVSLNK
jgi:hypothetical protein